MLLSAAAVTVNVSGIFPLLQNLTQAGENVEADGKQALLFRPVIHLFGRKNRTLDGEVVKVRSDTVTLVSPALLCLMKLADSMFLGGNTDYSRSSGRNSSCMVEFKLWHVECPPWRK